MLLSVKQKHLFFTTPGIISVYGIETGEKHLFVLPLLDFALYVSADVGVRLPWTHIIRIIILTRLRCTSFPVISHQFLIRGKK
jgi:hypothetical protein